MFVFPMICFPKMFTKAYGDFDWQDMDNGRPWNQTTGLCMAYA